MSIFLLFYKLLLEKESMHHFKRYFLLTTVIASFIIPQIVFTEYVEIEPTTAVTQVITINEPQNIQPVVQAIEKSPMNWSLILWTIYGLGVAGFALRFFMNLYKIWKRIHNNPKTKHSDIYRILLKEQLPPHTFLKHIFLNKQKFETKSIPDSVIKHEETHALQWHSLDILFLEVLQVVFWFNPLIYAFKKTIKLNHEFLADSAVLNGQEDHLNYQNTLLSYLSNDSFNTHQSVGIANAINYSSIKKRFIIMKKQTSKKGIAIRSLLLLPVLALMLYGFSQKNVIAQNTIKDINIEITKSGSLLINNEPVGLEKLAEKALNINQNIDTYIFKNYITAHILYDENQYKMIDQVQSELQSVGIFNIEHFSKRTTGIFNQNGFASSDYDGKTIDEAKKIRRNNVLNTHKTDANNEPLLEIAWIEIKNENEIWFNNNQIELSQLSNSVAIEFPLAVKSNKLAAQIYSTEIIDLNITDAISKELRKLNTKSITIYSDKYIIPADDYQEYIEITPKTTILKTNNLILQENATKEQISTYNNLAKSYNTMISKGGNIRIMKADIDNLNYIYGLMSEKQKVNAEPFPDFPEPPPVPKAPKAPNTADYADAEIERIIATQDTYDGELMLHKSNNLPHNNTAYINIDEELKYDDKKTENTRVYIYNSTSTKTNNPDLIKYLRELEKQDAQFYFESKKISSIEAFAIVDREKDIKIQTLPYANKQPEVRIYKKSNTDLIPPPPSPPTPSSPLDYAISMAKKGAAFFYKGKKVSSDKAIDLLKKNKKLNIESRAKNGKAEVRITKEPVTIR
ncbi:M56 family metallopeptidase [Maribacter sp. 1_MG-2023]|uniref:M56 family metallopeptidase n=1 Tax=Maribacter sp. 1_MG-2023 TaxID=3062677 RepID=UPI0026E11577|nr:M56 family metallopeptidase [Maribacter sp. 1_MG-2023]MDO6471471.1 M56 family metallopeptidase [Maribacter sp. 1_MG-2023]